MKSLKFILMRFRGLFVYDEPLPTLQFGRHWWVVESIRLNTESGAKFKYFEAAVGRTQDEVIAHIEQSHAKLDRTLMQSALEQREISSQDDWQPYSLLIEYVAITKVTTKIEITMLDKTLSGMLQEHEYFLEDFAKDPTTTIGGGFRFL